MKKLLFLTMAIMMILSCMLSSALAKEFPDVETSHWAYKYIDELSNKNIISGYPDGTYKPSGTVKRSEFVKLVIGACIPSGVDIEELATPFDHWAASYVAVAEQYGVLGTGEFNAKNIEEPITRLEMVRLVSNADIYMKQHSVNDKRLEQDFLDIMEMSNEDYSLLCHAVNSGLIKGYDDYTFKPEKTMNRAEAATMIWRFNGGREVAQ